MIKNEREVVNTVIKKMSNYTIKNDMDFKDYLHEVIIELIDFNAIDLYDYYSLIIYDNMVEIYNKLKLEEAV